MTEMIRDTALSAPPLAVASAKVFFGYSLPEWAAIVTIVYTLLLMGVMAWHGYNYWKDRQ